MELRRVVITGMGILCPVGNSVEEAWQNASQGKSGIATIKRFDATKGEVHFGGEIKDFDPKERFGHREARRMDRCTQIAMAAAAEALQYSGLKVENEDPYEVGCLIGSGIGGIESTL